MNDHIDSTGLVEIRTPLATPPDSVEPILRAVLNHRPNLKALDKGRDWAILQMSAPLPPEDICRDLVRANGGSMIVEGNRIFISITRPDPEEAGA